MCRKSLPSSPLSPANPPQPSQKAPLAPPSPAALSRSYLASSSGTGASQTDGGVQTRLGVEVGGWNKVIPPDVSVFAFRPVLSKQWGDAEPCFPFFFSLFFCRIKMNCKRTSTTIEGSGTFIVSMCARSGYGKYFSTRKIDENKDGKVSRKL